ncbi:hypothetical protein IJ114_02205 [Candidatus Saccharibacteria bacterium]|nr:hypothetical protein [Candidatus Saccharibacteria bacterium]
MDENNAKEPATPQSTNPAVENEVQPVEQGKSGKKSKKLIVGIIAAAILIMGGIVWAVIAIATQNTPESAVLEAVTKTIKEKGHRVNGTIVASTSNVSTAANSNNAGRVIIDLDSSNNGMNNTGSLTITVEGAGTGNYVLTLDEVFQEDGTLYIKATKLEDFVKSLTSNFGPYLNVTAFSNLASNLKALSAKIDSGWWRISIPEIVDAIGVRDNNFLGKYYCAVEATKHLFEQKGLDTLADTYKNNQFLTAAKSTYRPDSFANTSYEATINADKMTAFWSSYANSDVVSDIRLCNLGDGQKNTFSTAASNAFDFLANKKVYLDINGTHELSGIYINDVTENLSFVADLRISNQPAEITAPANSRPATELTGDIMIIAQQVAELFSGFQSND